MRVFSSLIEATLFMVAAHDVAQAADRPTEHIVFAANDTRRCLKCHGMANFAFRDSLTLDLHTFTVNADTFSSSVHGKLHCQQCHSEIKEYPHAFTAARAKVGCGSDCHAVDPVGKPYSHQSIFSEFQSSVHKKGLTEINGDSPNCTTCHGATNPHAVIRVKKEISIREKMALCVSCHENETLIVKKKVSHEAVASYKRSFHFKAIKFGETNTAVCQDCHTVHRILPKDSVQSSISTANISATCGQDHCHPGAEMNFSMSGANHLALRVEREPVLFYLEKFFTVLTLGTMAMLVVGIVLDVQKKFGWLTLLWKSFGWIGRRMQTLGAVAEQALKFGKKILID